MSRINTNLPALVAQGRLRNNQNDLQVRLERLATGLRINRGADDPAGLIISERLRKEIRGIEQAINNSQRVINVISTAEGALNEVSAMFLELSQGANPTRAKCPAVLARHDAAASEIVKHHVRYRMQVTVQSQASGFVAQATEL